MLDFNRIKVFFLAAFKNYKSSKHQLFLSENNVQEVLDVKSIFVNPKYIVDSPMSSYAPFVFWIVEKSRPKVILEIGTNDGFLYFSFCQAVEHLQFDTKCFSLCPDVTRFKSLGQYNHANYAGFSTVLNVETESFFKEPSRCSIDILHVANVEDVGSLEFICNTCSCKMSSSGVFLVSCKNNSDAVVVVSFLKSFFYNCRYVKLSFGSSLDLVCFEIAQNSSCVLDVLTSEYGDLAHQFFLNLGCLVSQNCYADMNSFELRTVQGEKSVIKEKPKILVENLEKVFTGRGDLNPVDQRCNVFPGLHNGVVDSVNDALVRGQILDISSKSALEEVDFILKKKGLLNLFDMQRKEPANAGVSNKQDIYMIHSLKQMLSDEKIMRLSAVRMLEKSNEYNITNEEKILNLSSVVRKKNEEIGFLREEIERYTCKVAELENNYLAKNEEISLLREREQRYINEISMVSSLLIKAEDALIKYQEQSQILLGNFSKKIGIFFRKVFYANEQELSQDQKKVVVDFLDSINFVDTEYYLLRYPDVLDEGCNATEHYFLYGASEGRLPFDLEMLGMCHKNKTE